MKKILKNIFYDTLISPEIPGSSRLFIASPVKLNLDRAENNKARYPNDQEIVLGEEEMMKHNYKEGDTVIVTRDPSVMINDVLVLKVRNGTTLGRTSLSDQSAAISPKNEIIVLKADQDGDQVLVIKVGEGGVPQSFVDAVTERGSKYIPFVEPTKLKTKLPITTENINKVIERQLIGDDQTEYIAKANSVMDMVIENNVVLKIEPNKNGKSSTYKLLVLICSKTLPFHILFHRRLAVFEKDCQKRLAVNFRPKLCR
jgi:hypothetical protein